MILDPDLQSRLIRAAAERLIAHADELTTLDQAIGDGDHGLNMKRGAAAVLADLDTLAGLPIGEALERIGKTLVMRVGGASGPLYGTLLMALGKAWAQGLVAASEIAVTAVMARGKSQPGQKTLLDVLVPVLEELRRGGDRLPARLRTTADAAAAATIPIRATRGRASFLGERSIGHLDPGARSAALIIAAVTEVLEAEA